MYGWFWKRKVIGLKDNSLYTKNKIKIKQTIQCIIFLEITINII